MTITTTKDDSGVLFATSEDEPTLFVSAYSRPLLDEAVVRALEELFVARDHRDLAVFPTESGASDHTTVAIVPRKVLEEPTIECR